MITASFAVWVPYIARAIAMPFRGVNWFLDYTPSVLAVILAVAFTAPHAVLLYGMAKDDTFPRAAYWIGWGVSIIFVAVMHFAFFDLRAGSTAALGAIFIPIYAAGIAVILWYVSGMVLKRMNAI